MNENEPSGTTPDSLDAAEFRSSVARAFLAGDERMARIEAQLQQSTDTTIQNTQAIKAVHERTDELVEVFTAMKGGFKVLGWMGQLFKWLAPIIGAYFALRQAGQSAGWWPFH